MYYMIWSSFSIDSVEEKILDIDEGPVAFIVELSESHPEIAGWLMSEEHNFLDDDDFSLLIYLSEVIFKSAAIGDPEVISDLTAEQLAGIEDELWEYDNKHKNANISERFLDRELCKAEPDLCNFIIDVIEDYSDEKELKPLIKSIFWVTALTIAEGINDYL